MPKIEAATVAEQRVQRYEKLITAAEEILAEKGLDALTAGAIARRAGIARNSLYRYFASIDDLVELVVTREFPAWVDAVQTAVDRETTPSKRIAAYVRSNVERSAISTHGWRSALSRASLSEPARRRVQEMHTQLSNIARNVLLDMHHEQAELQLAIIQSLVDACIQRIDAGDDPDIVLDYAVTATRRFMPPVH